MLAIDANFKLKLKSHGYSDVALGPGFAYFVDERLYDEFLLDFVDEEEEVGHFHSRRHNLMLTNVTH